MEAGGHGRAGGLCGAPAAAPTPVATAAPGGGASGHGGQDQDAAAKMVGDAEPNAEEDEKRKDEIKTMTEKMIFQLMKEQKGDDEHKGLCDTELATNERTRKEKSTAVEELHVEIDELNASIAKRTKEIVELNTAVSELDAAMPEATRIRSDEKAKNAVTITDVHDAQTAVAQAFVAPKELYAKAAESTEPLQEKQEPEIFDSPPKGTQGESGGVVNMLEVIELDFARLESETKVAKMIEDLIARIMEEANEEAEHKGWCDMDNKQHSLKLIILGSGFAGTRKDTKVTTR